MAAIGAVWASGTWVSAGGWAAGTWADEASAPALNPDLTTAWSEWTAALPGLPVGGGVNERMIASARSTYGASTTDLNVLLTLYVFPAIRG